MSLGVRQRAAWHQALPDAIALEQFQPEEVLPIVGEQVEGVEESRLAAPEQIIDLCPRIGTHCCAWETAFHRTEQGSTSAFGNVLT